MVIEIKSEERERTSKQKLGDHKRKKEKKKKGYST